MQYRSLSFHMIVHVQYSEIYFRLSAVYNWIYLMKISITDEKEKLELRIWFHKNIKKYAVNCILGMTVPFDVIIKKCNWFPTTLLPNCEPNFSVMPKSWYGASMKWWFYAVVDLLLMVCRRLCRRTPLL